MISAIHINFVYAPTNIVKIESNDYLEIIDSYQDGDFYHIKFKEYGNEVIDIINLKEVIRIRELSRND